VKIDLSVIIINYNTWHFLKPCIESIHSNFKEITYEIIVVDNASTDGSKEKIKQFLPKVILIENEENLGFAKANNQAIKIAKGKYIFLLNVDTVILNNKIQDVIKYLDNNPKIGLLGIQQQNAELLPIFTFSYDENLVDYKSSLLRSAFYLTKLKKQNAIAFNKILSVGYVNGAAVIVNKEILREIGFLDERFFFMAEEVDLAFRCHEHGYRVVYYPFLKVIHYGASGKGLTLWGLMQYHYSNFKLFEKYGSSKVSAVIFFVIWLLTRSIYSLICIIFFRETKVNFNRLKIYFKALTWHFSFGKLRFSIQYK